MQSSESDPVIDLLIVQLCKSYVAHRDKTTSTPTDRHGLKQEYFQRWYRRNAIQLQDYTRDEIYARFINQLRRIDEAKPPQPKHTKELTNKERAARERYSKPIEWSHD